MASMKIPQIDFSCYGLDVNESKGVSETVLKELAGKFDEALSTVGYLVLLNHGVSQQLINETFAATKTFFALPKDVKSKYELQLDTLHGWVKLGRESLDPDSSWEPREGFISRMGLHENGTDFNRPWPKEDEAPRLKHCMTNLFHQSLLLSLRVSEVLAIALGLEDQSLFARSFEKAGKEGGQCGLLANVYPPITTDNPEPKFRLGAHSDYGLLTLVYPATEPGLQFFQVNEDKWVNVPHIEGGVVLHIADLLQQWSADRFHSVLHRVVIPERAEDRKKARQSLVFFGDCDGDTIVTCYDGSNKYPPVKVREYVRSRIEEARQAGYI